MDLENSAGGPTSKEGCPFIVDFVLKEFAWSALPVSLFLPPTHFHLRTGNRDETFEDNSPPHLHDDADVKQFTHTFEKLRPHTHTCPCMSLQKPVGRPCTCRAMLHWWVRPLRRFSGPSSSPSSSCSSPSQRVSITTLPCRCSELIRRHPHCSDQTVLTFSREQTVARQ